MPVLKVGEPYTCKTCGNPKGVGNKWLLGVVGQVVSDKIVNDTLNNFYVGLTTWNDEDAVDKETEVFCSDKCALIWQQKELDKLGR
ncbi:MAG: hypothetical protein ACRYGG_00365 [Janthinobacterium lividum]